MKRLITAALTLAFASSTLAATKAGVTFKDAIKIKNSKLLLNGLGVREATVFNVDVYVAGIYLKKKTKDAKSILKSKSPKVLKMQFVRNVTDGDMNGAWDKSLGQAAVKGKFTGELAKLKKAMPKKLAKGDRMTFAFGKKNTYLLINDKKVETFKGQLFAKSLLGVWLGANPPNEGLKKGLLGIN